MQFSITAAQDEQTTTFGTEITVQEELSTTPSTMEIGSTGFEIAETTSDNGLATTTGHILETTQSTLLPDPNFPDEPISGEIPEYKTVLLSKGSSRTLELFPKPALPIPKKSIEVPFGILRDSNGTKTKKRCRCIEKKHRNGVKEIKYIPLAPTIHLNGETRNFTCKCSHLRKVVSTTTRLPTNISG